jgi:hypothetical protein
MAILKKRTSSRQLPDARGVDRAPLGSVIRGVDNTPFISDRGASSLTSAGGSGGSNTNIKSGVGNRPFTSTFVNPATKPTLTTSTSSTPKTTLTPKTSLTTKTSSTPKTTLVPKTTLTSKTTPTTKPTITNKTTTTPTTKTTTGTSTVKPTVKPKTTNTNSTTNKVVNALTGAAIGAGTKLLIDKITGKPNVSKTPAQIAAEKKALTSATSKDKAAAATATAAAKAKADAAAKAKAEAVKPKAPPTSVVKPPVTTPPAGNTTGTGFGDEKEEFTTDSLGNVYKTMPDGTYELYRAAEVPEDEFTTDSLGNVYKTMPDGTSELYRAAEVAEDEYMTDSLGNVYKTMPDGTYELYRAAEVDEDIDAFPPNTVDTDDSSTGFEPEYFEDSLGNVYISTADGGYDLYRAAEVDEDIYEDTPVADNTWVDDATGAVWTMGEDGTWDTDFNYDSYWASLDDSVLSDDSTDYSVYNDSSDYTDYPEDIYWDSDYAVNNDDSSYYIPYEDEEYGKRGGLITMMKKGGVAKFEDGGYVDNGDGTYTIGNFTYDMMTDEYLYSTDPDTGDISNVSPDAIYSTDEEEPYYDTDSLGNIFRNGEFYRAAEVPEDITSSGGGERPWYENLGNTLTGGANALTRLGSDALSGITGALGTTAGAAGAGALVATLLGQDFGGGTGAQNQGLDMSQVGLINPRTTDFGIGPTRFVGYEDYGTSDGDYTPNAELLKNLNAPGYNPVNEGDYGYEEVAAEEEAPKMASGGLSSMATPVASYYTFGQPADILANLGMRQQPPMNPPEMMPQIGQQQPPQQAQQQGLPQQQPPQMAQQMPQGMPQQGMMPQQQGMAPPMRKGGLPHVSDVPLTQGRMDFRKGAAVHGAGDGQSDDIPAMLADGEYVIDAETVAQIGNGSTKAGAQALDKFREGIRAHKRSAPINKIPPKTKALTSYLKGAK